MSKSIFDRISLAPPLVVLLALFGPTLLVEFRLFDAAATQGKTPVIATSIFLFLCYAAWVAYPFSVYKWITTHFVSEKIYSTRKLDKYLTLATFALSFIAIGSLLPLKNSEALSPFAGLLGLLIFATVLKISWSASKAILFAERGREGANHEAIGGFLAFIYLVIGIWFLNPRLKRLTQSREAGFGGQS